jgi:hypothetical protein
MVRDEDEEEVEEVTDFELLLRITLPLLLGAVC